MADCKPQAGTPFRGTDHRHGIGHAGTMAHPRLHGQAFEAIDILARDLLEDDRAVRVGRRNNSQLEVLDGLAAGDKVILSSYAAYGNSPRLQITQ